MSRFRSLRESGSGRLGRRLLLLTILPGLLAAALAGAETITWNNPAGGAWSNANNWSPAVVPSGAGQTAVLPALSGPYQVTLDLSPAVDALAIANGPTLDLNGNSLTSIGSVDNDGTIKRFRGYYNSAQIHNHSTGVVETAENDSIIVSGAIANDGTIIVGSTIGTAMRALGSIALTGTGTLLLRGQARIAGPNSHTVPEDNLDIQSGATLRGSGAVQMRIVNRGLLEGDGDHGPGFRVDGVVHNYATIRVLHQGGIRVNRPLVKNYEGSVLTTGPGGGKFAIIMKWNNTGSLSFLEGGEIVTDGGDLELRVSSLLKANLRTASSGRLKILEASFQDFVITPGSEAEIAGFTDLIVDNQKITNNGTLYVSGKFSAVQPVVFTEPHPKALTGSGVLVLEGGELAGNSTLVNEAGHTISGCGTISVNLVNEGVLETSCGTGSLKLVGRLDNRNMIRVPRGTLWINGADSRVINPKIIEVTGGKVWIDRGAKLDNTGGAFNVHNGVVLLGMNTSCTVVGGKLGGKGVFQNLKNATLENVTFGADAHFLTADNAVTTATGARFVNEGTNRIAARGSFVVDPATDYVQTRGLTEMRGGRLASTRPIQIQGGALRGGGVIAADVSSLGEVSPDAEIGALRIEGDYRQMAGATLGVGLGGTHRFGKLEVLGDAFLDGSVQAWAADFDPAPGNTFEVLSYRSRIGSFDACAGNKLDVAIDMVPIYGEDSFALMVNGVLDAGDPRRAPAALRFYGARSAHGASFVLDLPHAAELSVRAFDASGREVAKLADGAREPGVHRFALSGSKGLSSGVYFARATVRSAGKSETRTARVVVLQ